MEFIQPVVVAVHQNAHCGAELPGEDLSQDHLQRLEDLPAVVQEDLAVGPLERHNQGVALLEELHVQIQPGAVHDALHEQPDLVQVAGLAISPGIVVYARFAVAHEEPEACIGILSAWRLMITCCTRPKRLLINQ
jgi:hypothetical protein